MTDTKHIGGDFVSRQVPAGITTTVVDEWPNNGPHALFIHGTGMARGVWRPIAEEVSDRCHAVALDVRGHGDAPKLDGEYLWTDLADDIVGAMESEDWTPALLCGHSLGGAMAIDIAVRRPELVLGLVLLEPILAAEPLPPTTDRIVQMSEQTKRRRGDWDTREEAAEYLRARATYASWDEDVFQSFIDTGIADTRNGVALACPPEIEARIYPAGDTHTPFLQLAEVRCPVWFAYSVPPRAGMDAITGAIERTPTIFNYRSEGSGHFLPHERPEWCADVVGDALRYLAEHHA